MRERVTRVPFVAPVRLRNLLWLPVLGGVWLAGWAYGTPHLRVQYTYRGPYTRPHYLVCDYWGLSSFRLHPLTGECPIFVIARTRTGGAR